MTYPTYDDDNLKQLLIALHQSCINNKDDLMDALQFSDDLFYPMHMTTRQIVQSIRVLLGYYSDSTVDDLLELTDELFPEED